MARSGRRPAGSGTRDAIAGAARRQFASTGYDRVSLRSIASEAEVDPALVSYFFGSKHRLFVEVMDLPFDPAEILPSVLADVDEAGERLARFVLSLLEDPRSRMRLVGLVRAAASEPEAAAMARDLIMGRILAVVVEALGVDDAALRASLVGSQIVGLLMARAILGVEPLASLPAEEVVMAIAPNLQRYLTGPLEPSDLSG